MCSLSALYLHGFASSPGSNKARAIVPALEALGLPVAVPDLNDGGFTELSVSRALAQAQALLTPRCLVIGSSFGGYVAALLAARDPRVKALVLMAPAFDFAQRLRDRHGEAGLAEWRAAGSVPVDHYAYGEPRPISYNLYEDALNYPGRPEITVPCTILQGRQDEVVPPTPAIALAANHPNIHLHLQDDDHTLTASTPLATTLATRAAQALLP